MAREYNRKLVLADGTEFSGYGFGDTTALRVGELIFDTAMTGYQEMISDPASAGQMVVMTYPLIGNYGVTDEDFESKLTPLRGLVVREYNDSPSNYRCTQTLSEVLADNHIPAISGVDTRRLTHHIREHGSQLAVIADINMTKEDALLVIARNPLPNDLVAQVSCKKKWYSRTSNHNCNVVAIDCGVKLSVIRALTQRGCNVTIVPWNTTAEEIAAMRPEGVLISNGPGSPEQSMPVIETLRQLRGTYPLFGLGLGYQLLAMAYGAKIRPLPYAVAGGNHPVKNLATGRVEITSQGCASTVDANSLSGTGLTVTHVSLLDNGVEGIEHQADKSFGVQFHPESSSGPEDSGYLFDQFISLMKAGEANA